MKISRTLTDDAILAEIGRRIARRRLDFQFTQAEVAERAGIAKRTLERMEAGYSCQLSSLIRVLRVLDAMPGLDSMIAEADPRPMDLLQGKGKVRQRASRKRRPDPQSGELKKPWTWGDGT